jgi:hypothetical protein
LAQFECTRGNSAKGSMSGKLCYVVVAVIMLGLWAGTATKHEAAEASVADVKGQS